MAITARKRSRKVTSTRLKTYLDANKYESVLLGAVDRHLQLLPNDRDPTVIHPSEMSSQDWCHRATWLRLLGRKPNDPPPVSLRPSLVFDTGHTIHDKWQRWLRDMGILWGTWRCEACHEKRDAWSSQILIASHNSCPAFIGEYQHLWKYQEVSLKSDDKHRVSGHADGIVRPPAGGLAMLEVKSVGPGTLRSLDLLGEDESNDLSSDKFSRITRPLASHFRQTQVYLRLANEGTTVKRLGSPVDRGVVVYEHKADQQVKEFVVEYNARWTDKLFESAADIVWSIGRGREVRCPHGGCKKCAAFDTAQS